VAWNRACETMTGVKKDEVMGRDDYAYAVPFYGVRRPVLIDLLDASEADLGADYDHVERAGDTITAEAWNPEVRGGRGARLWGAAAPLFDRDGQRSGAIEVLRDVTEQRGVEAALLDNERKYRELVEHANSIILRWTRDGRITFLNEFGQRFFGYSAEDIVGHHVMGTIVPMTDGLGRDMGELMDKILADPIAFEQSVNENMLRSGERVWIAWTNRIVLDAEGEVAEVLSVGTDITGLKRAEKEIRELNAGLERRVAQRTAELAVARDRAEAADRLKSAFLATMSHELRTPLNSIIGFTGILLQEMAGPLGAEQRKQLEMVRDSSRHLLALINDVLDISKIEAGQMTVGSEPFDLRVSIENAVGLVRPLAEKKQLALSALLAPEIGTLVSDPRRVEQVLINLLNNAIKFTDEGAVTVAAEIAPPGNGAPHTMIRMSVTDTGIGIKPEDLGELFRPFRQIDAGLARQHEGTGLGLAICRRLAELLGGAVTAESEWGRGSVFTFTLPMDTTDVPEGSLP
jgi:PAS domain S-box-containing protein